MDRLQALEAAGLVEDGPECEPCGKLAGGVASAARGPLQISANFERSPLPRGRPLLFAGHDLGGGLVGAGLSTGLKPRLDVRQIPHSSVGAQHPAGRKALVRNQVPELLPVSDYAARHQVGEAQEDGSFGHRGARNCYQSCRVDRSSPARLRFRCQQIPIS